MFSPRLISMYEYLKSNILSIETMKLYLHWPFPIQTRRNNFILTYSRKNDRLLYSIPLFFYNPGQYVQNIQVHYTHMLLPYKCNFKWDMCNVKGSNFQSWAFVVCGSTAVSKLLLQTHLTIKLTYFQNRPMKIPTLPPDIS